MADGQALIGGETQQFRRMRWVLKFSLESAIGRGRRVAIVGAQFGAIPHHDIFFPAVFAKFGAGLRFPRGHGLHRIQFFGDTVTDLLAEAAAQFRKSGQRDLIIIHDFRHELYQLRTMGLIFRCAEILDIPAHNG